MDPSPDELLIRPAAAAEDLEPLLSLARRTFVDTFAEHNDPADFAVCLEEHYGRSKFARDLTDRRSLTLVVEDPAKANEMAAYARLRWDDVPACVGDAEAVQIDKLYVDVPYLGRGVGAMLMRRCLAIASEQGRRTIYLSVWEHNARAVRFYERWGFARCGERVFHVGSDPQIDWWMKRAVSDPALDAARRPADRSPRSC